MQEELYIIEDGERLKLNLNSPSGITLNYKSNLFGDISKITASHSYTFKLPMTANNRRILDCPEDIRRNSSATRQRFCCEFWQNGVDLFKDANLYVENTDADNFNAVMTWGVIRGLEAIKDRDMSIREIGDTLGLVGRCGNIWHPTPSEYSNNSPLLHPYRGLDIFDESKGKIWCTVNVDNEPVSKSGIPVVPIRYIVKRINQVYGTKFNLGSVYDGINWDSERHEYRNTSDSAILNRGVVPLVTTGLTDKQYDERKTILSNFAYYAVGGNKPFDVWEGNKFTQIITFSAQQPQNNSYFDISGVGNLDSQNWVFHVKDAIAPKYYSVERFKLDGHLRLVFAGCTNEETKLSIYQRVSEREGETFNILMKEVGSIVGRIVGLDVVDGETCEVVEFDFRKSNGLDPIEIEDAKRHRSSSKFPYFFNFSRVVKKVTEGRIEIIPNGKISDDVINKGYETDVFSCLPDISCMEFMKSLFYVIGAFPNVTQDGEIVPMWYSDLKKRVALGTAEDWSNKVMYSFSANPEKIEYKISGFSQNNYFLLKNDDLSKSKPDEGEDTYEAGKMIIRCDNNTLTRDKTVIQIPWHGAFLKSGKNPRRATGRDMKYDELDPKDSTLTDCEAKPALGIIEAGAEGRLSFEYDIYGNLVREKYTPNGVYRMFMTILNPFKHVANSEEYDYLQKIVLRPYIITEFIKLDEFDLRDVNYTVPVYIEKYNAYFAIISIQRDSSGKCKCELIKLPHNG